MLWWLPPALFTLGAMVWVTWLGRARSATPDRSEAAQAKLAAAIQRDLPAGLSGRSSRPHERSTGIAVRPSQRARPPADPERRSA